MLLCFKQTGQVDFHVLQGFCFGQCTGMTTPGAVIRSVFEKPLVAGARCRSTGRVQAGSLSNHARSPIGCVRSARTSGSSTCPGRSRSDGTSATSTSSRTSVGTGMPEPIEVSRARTEQRDIGLELRHLVDDAPGSGAGRRRVRHADGTKRLVQIVDASNACAVPIGAMSKICPSISSTRGIGRQHTDLAQAMEIGDAQSVSPPGSSVVADTICLRSLR